MAHVILRESWADQTFLETRTEGLAELARSVEAITPEVASLASGVPAELIVAAAKAYALGERRPGIAGDGEPDSLLDAPQPAPATPLERGHATILYAMGITQRSNGTQLVLALATLALLTGQIGKPSTGVNPLRGQSNVQGACDMGALPNVLPGYQPVGDEAARQRLARAWGVAELPTAPGLTVVEMFQAAAQGRLRAMVIMGENPMLSDPNLTHVEAGLRALDLLVVQDIFLSETAQLADVVLPAAASLEKDGTFTNTERRVQLLEPLFDPPGEAWPDWQITCALAEQLDRKLGRERGPGYWSYLASMQIMNELAAVTPIYRGIRHDRLIGDGLFWPCPSVGHPGTPILHVERFTRRLGKLHPVPIQGPAELPDEAFPLVLSTGRILYQYHTGTMTRRSAGLTWREPRDYAEINPADAEAAGVRDGALCALQSRRGRVVTQARLTERVPPGTVFLAFHWKEAPANLLTQDFALDPLAKIPEYKLSAVRLEVIEQQAHPLEPIAASQARDEHPGQRLPAGRSGSQESADLVH
jgi:predicted molibdopterin-dependent oxidoreductase YjgC